MKKIKKFKKGMTLLELVIVLALMSLVTMLVFNFTSLTQSKEKELDVKQALQHDGSMISESMVKNVLQCKGIGIVEGKNPTRGDNSIKSIKLKLEGEGHLPSRPSIDKVEEIEYRVEGKKLNLIAWRRINPTDIALTEEFVQTITENVEDVKIVNEKIVDELTVGTGKDFTNQDVKDALELEKGVNLEITLSKAEREGKDPIKHIHTCELNLRNS